MPMKNNRKKKNSQRLKWLHRQQVWQTWTFPTSLSWEMGTETKCAYPTVISQGFIRAAKSLSTADNDFMPCLQVSPRHRLLQLEGGTVDMRVTSTWIRLPKPGKRILSQPQS